MASPPNILGMSNGTPIYPSGASPSTSMPSDPGDVVAMPNSSSFRLRAFSNGDKNTFSLYTDDAATDDEDEVTDVVMFVI